MAAEDARTCTPADADRVPSDDAAAAKRAELQERMQRRQAQRRSNQRSRVTNASLTGAGVYLRDRLRDAILDSPAAGNKMVQVLAELIAQYTGCNLNEIVWVRGFGSWVRRTDQTQIDKDPEMAQRYEMVSREDTRAKTHYSWALGVVTGISFSGGQQYDVRLLGRRRNTKADVTGIRYASDLRPKALEAGDDVEWFHDDASRWGRRAFGKVISVRKGSSFCQVAETESYRNKKLKTGAFKEPCKVELDKVTRNLSDNVDLTSFVFYSVLKDPRVGLLDAGSAFVRRTILNLNISDILPTSGPTGQGFINVEAKVEEGVQNFVRKKAALVRKALHSEY